MGRSYDKITDGLRTFIGQQPMFFVATAPLGADGHVNVSPKGMDSLRILDASTIAYVDLVGSGAETIAHLRENGRITVMWCSFGSAPRILRAYGSGEYLLPGSSEFSDVGESFPRFKAVRSIVKVAVERLADSCGYGVPELDLIGQRARITEWGAGKTPEELDAYQREKNSVSIDGLPALGGMGG